MSTGEGDSAAVGCPAPENSDEAMLGEMLLHHVNEIATEIYRLRADPAAASSAFSSCPSDELPALVVVPGNPGVVGFYRYYADRLWGSLGRRYTVVCIGHAGHMANHSRYHPEGPVYDLEQQIEHKCVFLTDHLAELVAPLSLRRTAAAVNASTSDGECASVTNASSASSVCESEMTAQRRVPRVVLIGHSIGGYICLHSMRRTQGRVKVLRCVHLMATLQHLGKGLTPGVRQLVRPGFMQSMGAVLHYSPNFLKRFLIRFVPCVCVFICVFRGGSRMGCR
jgi:Lipid-droplet associated hydrolase